MFKHFRDCISKLCGTTGAQAPSEQTLPYTLFFVGKQEYLFQAIALPAYSTSDADTITHAPTDILLVLDSSERVHILRIWGICILNITLDPNQTYSIIHPTMLFQHALICYIKAEKEQVYFVLIFSGQDGRTAAMKVKKNHLKVENTPQHFLIMLPSNTYKQRLPGKGRNKKKSTGISFLDPLPPYNALGLPILEEGSHLPY